jgi:hypothetical protein
MTTTGAATTTSAAAGSVGVRAVAAMLAEDVGRQRQAAWRRYAEVLNAAAGASAEQAVDDAKALAALRSAAEELGKSPADVEADGRVLAHAAKLRVRVEARPGMEAMRAARRAVDEYDAETLRVIAERKQGYARVYAVYRDIGKANVAADAARRELDGVIAANPELLGSRTAESGGEDGTSQTPRAAGSLRRLAAFCERG